MVVKRFSNRGYEREDLFQVGAIGLLKAIDGFEEERGFAFSTYAVPLIIGEIRRFLRDDQMVHQSRSLKECAGKLARFREECEKTLHRAPTMEEMEQELGVSKELILQAMESMQSVADLESAYEVCDSKDDYENSLNRLTVQQALDKLEPMEQKLMQLRFFQEMTQTQVAKEMGCNQVWVSRMEKKILRKLRTESL